MVYYTNATPSEGWQDKVEPKASPSGDARTSAKLLYRPESDTLWVTHEELTRLGIEPHDFDVVHLNGRFYELSGRNRTENLWWLEPINIEHEVGLLDELPIKDQHEDPIYDLIFELEDDD